MAGFEGKPVTKKAIVGSKKPDPGTNANVPKEATKSETHKAPNS